ncbi:MAG: flagellar hook-associated protein FlgL [Deltaproteobacteria bacterium]|nr:flagellar hook-associated protein FlgL [Deltaproteobacteria bacterium]
MRVSTQTLFLQTQEGIQRASQRLAQLQEAVASGKRINDFLDDHIGAMRALDLRGVETMLGQYDKNIDAGLPFLEQNDAALGEVVEIVGRAKELTLQMANDSNSAQDRQVAAREVQQLFQRLLSVANTRVEDRYIFGGFKNGVAPFTAVGAYNGDSGEIAIQANSSIDITLNLPGNKVFQGAGVTGGVGLFDVLRDLQTVLGGSNGVNPLSLALAINLDATAVTPGNPFPAGPDDTPANWQAGSNFSTTVTLFDAVGTAHDLTFLFRKTGATTWDYQVVANRKELDAGAPTSTDLRQVGSGTLAFNVDGTFNAGGSTINPIGPLAWANGATSQTIAATDLSFTGSTQLAQPSAVTTLSQSNTDGFNQLIARLDGALDHILGFRAEVGARVNTARATKESVELIQTQTVIRRGEIEGADLFQLYSDFARAQHAFEATLQSAVRVTQTSLLDFLR